MNPPNQNRNFIGQIKEETQPKMEPQINIYNNSFIAEQN
jgi:hypothetical protein